MQPTEILKQEHRVIEQVLACLDKMAAEAEAVGKFVEHARGYVELLREHIAKEDHCLFPMADNGANGLNNHPLGAIASRRKSAAVSGKSKIRLLQQRRSRPANTVQESVWHKADPIGS